MEFGLLGPVSLVITDVAWFTGAIAHPTSAPACPTAVQRLLAMKSAIRLSQCAVRYASSQTLAVRLSRVTLAGPSVVSFWTS
jgi:hypothetical protein